VTGPGTIDAAARLLSEADLAEFGRAIWPDLTGRPATAVNQAKFGLSRIMPVLNRLDDTEGRILEVGAGSMLLSAYLASKGFLVTALEPLTPDFSWFSALQSQVLAYCKSASIQFERVAEVAETYVAPSRFDFIFTIHVLEHMRDPWLALENMYESLKKPGFLLAVCPNYDVPFEPHLGVVLLSFSKPFNARVYRRRIATKQEIWQGLIFIRYTRLRKFLDQRSMRYTFNRCIVRDMFMRLGEDKFFYRRMPRPVRLAYWILSATGAIGLLSLMPLRAQTPMEVLVSKQPHDLEL
jgi:2-polyprenyl-3-methyl-5-hydroxy-6-metoxy-1,4-benzoquinol methylase